MSTIMKGELVREYVAANPLSEVDQKRIVGEAVPTDGTLYMRKQRSRRGVTGYKGDPKRMVVIDPDTGKEVKDAVTPNAKSAKK